MDSFERVFFSLENKFVDRPPVIPHIGDHAGIIQNLTYDIMYTNADKAAEAHLKALDLYGYDIITIQVEPSWPVAEACGAEVTYHKEKNPWIKEYLIKKEEDLKRLEIPDFMEIKSSRVMIEGTQILADNAHVPVVAYMTGPITFSLQLMPYKEVLMRIMRNPDFVHQLIAKTVQIIEAYVRALKEAGAQILVICEHDIQMMAPHFVKEFSLDYLPEIFKIYGYNILHMCGKITPHLNMIANDLKNLEGLNTLNIGPDIDIEITQKLLDYKIGIAGNIDHIKLLPKGHPKEIEAAVHSAIKKSGSDYRFMLTPGCEITSDTPIENVKTFVKATQTYQN
jgi:uroporphyrinogen decarboxylase